MPSLDYRYFPHQWDQILAHMDFWDKLDLREVSQSLNDLVDRSLCTKQIQFPDHRKFGGILGQDIDGHDIEDPMPFFSPWSSKGTDIQALEIHRATSLRLSVPNAPRIFRVLETELRPEAEVVVDHGDVNWPQVDKLWLPSTAASLPTSGT